MLSIFFPGNSPLHPNVRARLSEVGATISPEFNGYRLFYAHGVVESVSLILASEIKRLRETKAPFEIVPDSAFWSERHRA
jgi:hypothetical protein